MTRFLFLSTLLFAAFSCDRPKPRPDTILQDTVSAVPVPVRTGQFKCRVDGKDFGYDGDGDFRYTIPKGVTIPQAQLKFRNREGHAIWIVFDDDDSMKTLPRTVTLNGPDRPYGPAKIVWMEQELKTPFYDQAATGSTLTITAWDRDARKISGNFEATVSDHDGKTRINLSGSFTDVICE